MAADEVVLGGGRFGTDRDGYAAMLRSATQWQDRVWAIEGCTASVGTSPIGCWPTVKRWWTCRRSCRLGRACSPPVKGRKTDATDAHSVALVGTRMAGLRPVVNDEQLAVLRILVDRQPT
jgi:hypothetical protein